MQRIPATKTPSRAFQFLKATTRYYHSQVTKMYRKMETLISYSAYEKLWAAWVLDIDICQSLFERWQQHWQEETETGRKKKKRVPVDLLEFKTDVAVASATGQMKLEEIHEFCVTESEAESESSNDIGKKRKGKEKGKVQRRYAYTVIFKQPKEAKARVMTTEEGIRTWKFLNPEMESADIEVVSFHDMVREAKE